MMSVWHFALQKADDQRRHDRPAVKYFTDGRDAPAPSSPRLIRSIRRKSRGSDSWSVQSGRLCRQHPHRAFPFTSLAAGWKSSAWFSRMPVSGIPLVTGLLGIEAVFYLSPVYRLFLSLCLDLRRHPHVRPKDSVTIRKIITNPCIWAMIIGIVVFFCFRSSRRRW